MIGNSLGNLGVWGNTCIMGFLVTACGLGGNELGVSFVIAGFASASVGSLIFIFKFKQWIVDL